CSLQEDGRSGNFPPLTSRRCRAQPGGVVGSGFLARRTARRLRSGGERRLLRQRRRQPEAWPVSLLRLRHEEIDPRCTCGRGSGERVHGLTGSPTYAGCRVGGSRRGFVASGVTLVAQYSSAAQIRKDEIAQTGRKQRLIVLGTEPDQVANFRTRGRRTF